MDYRFTVKWNKPASCWIADITDVNGNAVLNGISLVTGADLLDQYGYLRLGGQLIAQTAHDADAVPTFENLGGDGKMFFMSP